MAGAGRLSTLDANRAGARESARLEQSHSNRSVLSWLRLRVALSGCIGGIASRLLRPPRHTRLANAPNAPFGLKPLYHAGVTILVNGEVAEIRSPCTVAELLRQYGLADKACAVEVNSELVPKRRHLDHPLRDGDRVELVTLVGGG